MCKKKNLFSFWLIWDDETNKNKAIICLKGRLFHCDTQRIHCNQPFSSPPLSSTDSAHSLLWLSHLLGEVVCSYSPVPNLCPQSGPRPFSTCSSGCPHCAPLLKSFLSAHQAHLLLFTSWSLLLFLAFSVLFFFWLFVSKVLTAKRLNVLHLTYMYKLQIAFFLSSKTVFFFNSWSNCITVKWFNIFLTCCWIIFFELPERASKLYSSLIYSFSMFGRRLKLLCQNSSQAPRKWLSCFSICIWIWNVSARHILSLHRLRWKYIHWLLSSF